MKTRWGPGGMPNWPTNPRLYMRTRPARTPEPAGRAVRGHPAVRGPESAPRSGSRVGTEVPPVRKIRTPSSTDRSGNRTRSREHSDVPEIQVIGRHVDGHERLGGSGADERELARQEAEHVARAPLVPTSTTLLKPDSLSGENAATSCLTGAYTVRNTGRAGAAPGPLQRPLARPRCWRSPPPRGRAARRRHQPHPRHLAPELPLDEPGEDPGRGAEAPDERHHADDERDGDEEPRDEPPRATHHRRRPYRATNQATTVAASARRYHAKTASECDAR